MNTKSNWIDCIAKVRTNDIKGDTNKRVENGQQTRSFINLTRQKPS